MGVCIVIYLTAAECLCFRRHWSRSLLLLPICTSYHIFLLPPLETIHPRPCLASDLHLNSVKLHRHDLIKNKSTLTVYLIKIICTVVVSC